MMAYPSKIDRAAILAAAAEQLDRVGVEQLSLRSLAAQLGVAPNALYRYFADRAHLQAALASHGAEVLLGLLRKAAGKKAPESAIRAMAAAYLRFARERRSLHAVAMMRCDWSHEDAKGHEQLWLFFVSQIARIAGEARAGEAGVALWAFLRGIAELEAAEIFSEEKPASSLEFGIEAWLAAATSQR